MKTVFERVSVLDPVRVKSGTGLAAWKWRSYRALDWIFANDEETGIAQAYREHGYRLQEIGGHLGVHYATVSRKLKKIERRM